MAAPINAVGPKSDKIWRDAVMRAVRRLETDEQPKGAKPEQRLERLADALVAKGLEGDVPALREVGDRLDGKPNQTISGDPDAPLFSIDGLRELLGAKLDRIPIPRSETETQDRLN